MSSTESAEPARPPSGPPPHLFRPRKRRRRGLLLLGMFLTLVIALILAEMRNARLSDQNQQLAAQCKELREKSEARDSADTAALKAQLSVLRRKVGLLEIEDASKPYAVALEADATARYRWRVFIPSEGKFAVKCSFGTEAKELDCKPGEQIVVLNLTRRNADDKHPMLFFGFENNLTGLNANSSESADKETSELYSSQASPETTAKGLQLFKGKVDAEGSANPRSTPLMLSIERGL